MTKCQDKFKDIDNFFDFSGNIFYSLIISTIVIKFKSKVPISVKFQPKIAKLSGECQKCETYKELIWSSHPVNFASYIADGINTKNLA